MVTSKIKSFRTPEPYKGKGIKGKRTVYFKKRRKEKVMKLTTSLRKKFRVRNKVKKVAKSERFRLEYFYDHQKTFLLK